MLFLELETFGFDEADASEPEVDPLSGEEEEHDLYGNFDGGHASHEEQGSRRNVTGDDVGKRVRIQGYSCSGTLRFFGQHKAKGTARCGVELDEPLGKNDGRVGVSKRQRHREEG